MAFMKDPSCMKCLAKVKITSSINGIHVRCTRVTCGYRKDYGVKELMAMVAEIHKVPV